MPDAASIRSRIRAKFATASNEAFDLLKAIGRDCVGAVQLLPDGETPDGFDRIEAEPLSEDSAGLFAEIISAAPRAVEEVAREIKSGFPAQVRDQIFEGFLTAVLAL